jgi:hypothetical protein
MARIVTCRSTQCLRALALRCLRAAARGLLCRLARRQHVVRRLSG